MIAVQLYTVRTLLQDPSRIGQVLGRLHEIGYRAVEIAGVGPNTIARFGEELKRSGLLACAAHVSLDRVRGDLDGVVGECRDWGCQYVVVPGLPDEYRTPQGYGRFATESAVIAERLHASGLHLVYHNHAYELERYGEYTGLDLIFATNPASALQAELDTYWLQYGGANPAGWIRRFAHRVPLVHLKDMSIDRGRPVDAEVGAGNLDWPDILSACREAETRWLVVEQDAPRRDPLESVAISYTNLTRLLNAAGWEG